MQRRLDRSSGRPEIVLSEISDDDLSRIESALERFGCATGHNNKTLCERILSEVRRGQVATESLEHLSVWCHTRQPPRRVNEAAEVLARLLLGVVPPRLLERGKKRVRDYESLVDQLQTAIERPVSA